jgi:hypothetical protein
MKFLAKFLEKFFTSQVWITYAEANCPELIEQEIQRLKREAAEEELKEDE